MNIKKIIKITFKIFLIILGLIVVFLIGFFIYLNSLLISNPEFADNYQTQPGSYTQLDDSTRIFGNNSLRKLQEGFYEMYVEGEPFERGNAIGILTSDLHEYQEDAFINQIKKMIPGEFYLKFLKYFVAFFNRDIEEHIPKEYLEEIYGESLHMNSKYDNIIGSPYMRILNYHAAHDIGHALQDKNFVAGCTSFAAWGSYTEDGKLLVGRNFDFYVGDEFAKNKIVAFIKPDKGIPFGMVTWPGMIGVVSGINKEQITITINAAKSAYPTEAKTPVSILAREILQYAHNLDEAIKIAGKFDLFVSESLLIASGKENKAIIIEKSPEKMDVFAVNDSILYCSNHFQSKAFSADSNNIKFKNESSSNKRFTRLKELVINNPLLNPSKIASILRDPYGPQGKEIGWGNEDAINQLIAHHGVIFKPSENEIWVSTAPFQLGKFIRFDLDEIFNQKAKVRNAKFDIPADSELIKVANKPYQEFRKQVSLVRTSTDKNLKKNILKMNNLNPEFYLGYEVAGDYYSKNEMIDSALISYKRALKCDIPLKKDSLNIIHKLSRLNNK